MEYILVAIGCFLLGILYKSGDRKFDLQIMKHLKDGKRVIICVDDDATIMERFDNKIRITKAIMNLSMESFDDVVDDSGPSESSDSSPPVLPH